MEVTNEVDDPFQLLGSFLARLRLVRQSLDLGIEGVDHVVAPSSVALLVEGVLGDRDMNVMPGSPNPRAIPAAMRCVPSIGLNNRGLHSRNASFAPGVN